MNKPNKQPENIIGQKFGDITITKEFDRTIRPNGTIIRNFEGICKCGTNVMGTYQSIKNKEGCPTCKREKRKKLKMENILYKKYNRLTIITEQREDGKVLCSCECGKTKWIMLNSVVNNITFSCGCIQRERTQSYIIDKYSIDNHPEIFKVREDKIKRDTYVSYIVEARILKSIISLCNRPQPKYSKYYLDKGIKVCDRWKGDDGIVNFLKDMGIRPSPFHKLQRLDISKDFEPDNCVWYIKE
jgi:hypothetical protein